MAKTMTVSDLKRIYNLKTDMDLSDFLENNEKTGHPLTKLIYCPNCQTLFGDCETPCPLCYPKLYAKYQDSKISLFNSQGSKQ